MANIRISQLPTAPSAITGAELIPIVQNGETVQTTISSIINSPSQTQTFLTINQESTLPNSQYLGVSSDLSLTNGGAQGMYKISLNGALANLNALGNGLVVKTGTNTLSNRSIAISGNGLSVSNGDGVAGNPTLSVINNLANIAGATGTGILGIDGNNTLNIITIVGTTNQINVANGATSPVISITNNPVLPGTGSVTLPTGNTAARSSPISGMMRYNSETSVFEGYSAGAWGAFTTGTGVSSFSAGSTGLTPNSATLGGIVLAGILNASSGGSGVAGTLTGLLYANGTGTYTVATTAQALTLIGTVPIANGGTGQTTAITAFNALSPLTTSGDILYANATNSSTRLAIGTTGQILSVVAGFPAWTTLSSSVVTSFSGGSTGFLPVSPSTGAISLSGTLNILNGGTGQTTANAAFNALSPMTTAGDIIYGGSSGLATRLGIGTTGQILTVVSGNPSWATLSSSAVTTLSFGTTGLTPSTATSGVITVAGTLNVANGGTGVTASSGANSVVLRDANVNSTINNLFLGFSTVVSAGGTTVLTVSSAANYYITGSTSQTFQLPNATTLVNGAEFTFNNNSSASTVSINNGAASPTLVASVGSGGFVVITLLDNSTQAGVWDKHYQAPSNTIWSTNTFTTGSAIVSTQTVQGTQLISTVATGTAPLTVASTTQVANLNAANAGTTTLAAGSGATNYIIYASATTGNQAQYTSTGLTFNATNTAITGGINGGTF
jgi:hypothetical protein